jgi:uncharacterized membrane protein
MNRACIFLSLRGRTVALALISIFFLAKYMHVLAMIFGAGFLLGLGEWINHPTADVPRKANWLGILLEVAGVVLMIYGTYLGFKEP